MVIVFSDHAKRQISQRGILRKKIINTINNPDEILQTYRNRQLRRKRFGSKLLEVITRVEDSKVIVITAYYLDN